jgi:hypothetical protein
MLLSSTRIDMLQTLLPRGDSMSLSITSPYLKKQGLGRNNSLLSFDMTRAA